jgi:osmotically-inducible protein OsmY
MTLRLGRVFATTLFATLLSAGLIAGQASSAAQATDLTPQFRAAGVAIKDLKAFEIGGVVILRGHAVDRATAEAAGRAAQELGYARVANLVQVVPRADDAAIERIAERELATHRSLDGCTFHIDSQQGVVYVQGQVSHELQKDMAVELLRNIDGVKAVHADLQKR